MLLTFPFTIILSSFPFPLSHIPSFIPSLPVCRRTRSNKCNANAHKCRIVQQPLCFCPRVCHIWVEWISCSVSLSLSLFVPLLPSQPRSSTSSSVASTNMCPWSMVSQAQPASVNNPAIVCFYPCPLSFSSIVRLQDGIPRLSLARHCSLSIVFTSSSIPCFFWLSALLVLPFFSWPSIRVPFRIPSLPFLLVCLSCPTCLQISYPSLGLSPVLSTNPAPLLLFFWCLFGMRFDINPLLNKLIRWPDCSVSSFFFLPSSLLPSILLTFCPPLSSSSPPLPRLLPASRMQRNDVLPKHGQHPTKSGKAFSLVHTFHVDLTLILSPVCSLAACLLSPC